MANLGTPFRLYKDIDLSFTRHSSGDVGRKVDVNAVRQALSTLIFTQFGERPFQPGLGSPLYRLLFEPMDAITVEVLKKALENVIQNYEPRVILDRIDLVPFYDENSYELTIFFTVVGIPTPVTYSTTLKRLR